MRFQVFFSLWSVTSWLCIDKIPEVAKTKVSKPKRYSLSKLRLVHALLKWLIQTRPHMSTSRCGNICVMPPKCTRKERRRGFSNRSSVDAAVSGRHCVFLCESKSTLFGLPRVDAIRIIKIIYNTTATHFMDDRFVNRGEEVILTLLWQSGASESVSEVCFVINLSICYWLFKCGVLRVVCVCARVCVCACACVWERERDRVAACLQTHTSIITVSITRLCSPFGLELMVKLRTLLTVFTFILKAEVRDYGKWRYISDECLWCSANHNALCQLANQSRLRLSKGGTL